MTRQPALIMALAVGLLVFGSPMLAAADGANSERTEVSATVQPDASELRSSNVHHRRPLDRRHRSFRGRSGRWW